MIQKVDYKDWYINQGRIPDKQSQEYKQFFDFHKDLCTNGCYIDDTYITPFLYWHLNFWHTEVDFIDEYGRISQKYANPTLRDNEWLVATEIHRAETEHKGIIILGIRRFAKSVLSASYMAHGATFDQNSQNVVSGLNAGDIKLITDKIDKGLNFVPEAWRWQRIEDNWKNQVTFGIKTKTGERIPFSQILIRNLDDGNNEEAIAGTKPRRLIIDEFGKGSALRALQAAIPGFSTPFGWGCSPICLGTGGDMKKFQDAKTLMFDVERFNFLSYQNEKDSRRIHGLFIGAKYRLEAKEPSTLGKFLNKPINSPLHEISMQVSNEEKALKITNDILEQKKKAGDRQVYLKEKMYYPIEVDDIFLNEDTNIFNIDTAKMQQSRIKNNDIRPFCYFLQHDGENIVPVSTDKLPITSFPYKSSEDGDAPICIWEMPMKDPPFGLYLASCDPYRHNQSKYSDSLGVIYIFKRIHDIHSEKFQDMFVASYAARPESKDKWNEQARLLIKFYNARAIIENDEMSFIEYMKAKGDTQYLETQPPWLKEIVPNTSVKREYGIHRSSPRIINYLHGCLKRYLEESIETKKDENGSIISETPGVFRILDPMLLEEIINFNEEGNFDRIVAAELALALAAHLDPLYKVSSLESDPRMKSLFNKNKNKSNSLFGSGTNLFSNRRNNKLFG